MANSKTLIATTVASLIWMGTSQASTQSSFSTKINTMNEQIDQQLKLCAIKHNPGLHWDLQLQSSFPGLGWLKAPYALTLTTERLGEIDQQILRLGTTFKVMQTFKDSRAEAALLNQSYRYQAEAAMHSVRSHCDQEVIRRVNSLLSTQYQLITQLSTSYDQAYSRMLDSAKTSLSIGRFEQQASQAQKIVNELGIEK